MNAHLPLGPFFDPALRASLQERAREHGGRFGREAFEERTAALFDILEREYARWRERDELFTASVLGDLAWVELWSGNWELAAGHAAGARELGVQYGIDKNQDYIPSAWVAAHRGLLALAREQAERGLELCVEQVGLLPPLLLAARGLAAFWDGDVQAGGEWLGEADRQAGTLGWGEARMRPWTAEYVEALLTSDAWKWWQDKTKLRCIVLIGKEEGTEVEPGGRHERHVPDGGQDLVVDGRRRFIGGVALRQWAAGARSAKVGYRSRANLIWRMTFSVSRCPSRIDVRDMLRGVMRRRVDPADISVRPTVDQIDPSVAGMSEDHHRRAGHIEFHDGFAHRELL